MKMSFWEKIRSDLEQGIAQGIEIAKESAAFVKQQTEKLTEKGKRRLSLFDLKIEVRKEMTELGGRIYHLRHQGESLLSDNEVKAIIERIENLEKRITEFEEKGGQKVGIAAKGGEDEEIKERKTSH